MAAKPEYSIWLLPAAAQETTLTAAVVRLSAELSGITFVPHITVQGDLALPFDALGGLLQRIAVRTPAQRWRVQGVETSDQFFRCLYLRFVDAPAFAAMQSETRHFTGTADGLSPFAHLSLAYGAPRPDASRLRETLAGDYAGTEIVFDRLVLARSSKYVPVADWRCLAQYRLQAQ